MTLTLVAWSCDGIPPNEQEEGQEEEVIYESTATYTLSIGISPSGAGSVDLPGGEYESGLQVTLTATPISGYAFEYWDGDASGSSASITVTMDSDISITANFSQITYDLTMDANGIGTTSPSHGVHSYPVGTQVEISATPARGWEFSYWSGDISDTSVTVTIAIDSDKTLVAHFIDVSPPIISSVVIHPVTDTKATVTWHTDEMATSQIEYGITPSYGSVSALDERYIYSHTLTLTGLMPDTTYHYRLSAVDKAGNVSVSEDSIFTTKTVEELMSSSIHSAITIGDFVHQIGYYLANGSSQTITVIKVEFFNKNGIRKHTVSESTIQGTSHKGQLLPGNTFNWSVSFQVPYSTEEIEGWQVKWYCKDVNGHQFIVIGHHNVY